MASESNITYTGNIDVGSLLKDIAAVMPDSPFVKGFFRDLAQPLIDKIKESKVKSLTVDLGNLFGLDAEYAKDVKTEFQKVTKKLLQSVRKQLGSISNIKLSEKFDINKLIGQTPKFDFLTRDRYQTMVTKFLKKVQDALSGNITINKEAKISDLIGSTPKFDILTRLKYQGTVTKFLKKVQDALGRGVIITQGLNISSLIGETPQFSRWSRFRYQGLVQTLLARIRAQTEKLVIDKKFNLQDMLGSESFSRITKISYQKTIRGILKTLQNLKPKDLIGTKIDLSKVVIPILPKQKEEKDTKKRETFVSDFTKIPSMIVTDFSETAINKLKGLLGLKRKETPITNILPTKGGKGWLSKLLEELGFTELLPALLATLGAGVGALGIAAGLHGLLTNTKFKGLEKVITRASMSFITGLTKRLGSLVTGAFKLLRLNRIFSFVPKLFKSIFSHIGGEEILKKVLPKGLSSLAGKISLKFLSKTVLKKIPFGIGALISLGYAIGRFSDGDWKGGLLDIASGVASIVPGIGTAISILIDIFSAARDIETGGSKEVGKTSGFSIKGIISKIKDLIMDNPLMRWLSNISDGIKKIFNGDMDGLKMLSDEFPFLTPAVNFLKSSEKIGKATGNKIKNFFHESGDIPATTPPTPDPSLNKDPDEKSEEPKVIERYYKENLVIPKLDTTGITNSSTNDSINDVNDTLDDHTKLLGTMSSTMQNLLVEFRKTGKNISVMTANSGEPSSSTNTNYINQQTLNNSGMSTVSRDPAYDLRKDVWFKMREA